MNNTISEIIDIPRLQSLMEKFTGATGIGTAVLDLEGNVLVASGWQEICTKFHRVNPETCANCSKSDTALANDLKKGSKYNVYKCLNGLVDCAVPIEIDGIHIGNLFIGQFLMDEPDLEFFRNQARQYGFDQEAYLNALSKVAIIPEQDLKYKMEFLSDLAIFIADLGLNRMKLKEQTENLELKIAERTRDYKESQIATLNMMQDANESRKEAEQVNMSLEKTMTDLERSNKELEQFAYVASHDLQEPLRMISSYTQLLAKRYEDKLDEDANDFIKYAVDGSVRMQKLINDLLSYSRITTRGQKFQKVDSSMVLGEAIANLRQKIEETRTIITNDEMPEIRGDEGQLVRLFQNLLDNAIKYKGKDSPHIHITAKPVNKFWEFHFKDNGVGIEAKYAERIFIIFQRLHNKENYPGTGIGLAICKRIVERHGGKIWIESVKGKGTSFIFTIPK